MPPLEFADEIKNFGDSDLSEAEEERRRGLYEAAASYWGMGFRVIPLHYMTSIGCSCGTAKCSSAGKHPVQESWQQPDPDAAGDARWWRDLAGAQPDAQWRPQANIGILTGEVSGIFVLDVDPVHGGDVMLEQLQAEHEDEPIPDTLITETGSGGRHYYFRWPGFRVGNLKPWGKAAGLDIKGDGGQVVAPPSISGVGPYRFLQPLSGHDQIGVAPPWILTTLIEENAAQWGERIGNPVVLPQPVISKYVQAAVRGQAESLRGAPGGSRNNTLNAAAHRLGSLAAHGFLSEEDAWTALQDAALAAGLSAGETRQTFSSGWRAGLQHPADLSKVGQIADHDWPLLPQDDFGLADRLVVYRGTEMRWVETWQSWMICSNGRWHRRSEAEAERLAQDVLRLMMVTELPRYSGEPEEGRSRSPADQFHEWHKKQRTHGKVVAMVKLARDRPSIRAESGDFDERPYLLAVANGVVSLAEQPLLINGQVVHATAGQLLPHDPDLMMTLQSPVHYDPAAVADPLARAPLWAAFLERVQPDPEIRAYLQRIMGYSATGSTGEQVMFLHHGSGANGKSVFHDVCSYVLGPYAQATPVETLTAKRADGRVPNDVARMVGRRYLVASEAKEGKQLDWQLLKLLISGDMVAARFMRAEFFEFRPIGKIHLTANHLPPVPGDDPAIWRRLNPVSWPAFIPPEERDGDLADKLRGEATGILAWIVQGAIQWGGRRLSAPGSALQLKEEYRAEEDIVTPLFEEEVLQRVPAVQAGRRAVGHDVREIYAACRFWWQSNGHEPLSQRGLTAALMKMGYTRVKSNGRSHFTDLAVRVPAGEV